MGGDGGSSGLTAVPVSGRVELGVCREQDRRVGTGRPVCVARLPQAPCWSSAE